MPNPNLDTPKLNYRRKFIINLQNKLYKNLEQKNMPDSISSIIIFAQEKLGDAILLLPFLNAFHKRFPDAVIDLCCTYYNKKVFEGIPFIRIEGPLSVRLDNYFKKNNFTPNYVTTTDTYQIAKSFVDEEMGITILDQISATNIDTDGVKTWPLESPLKFEMKMVYSNQKVESIVLNNFKSFLASYNFKL